ncbi:ATP-dependent protease La [Candidatus Syntrophocurvum alkaliphilum]|uniref:endopeptidase La n=1 Tax=Candidatus Syntrophocurvum alkaliphilum TaxID=2293317 RepID=A0A6I6DLP1_9FIRM|nr:ATP-dependent protease LonB [Candidatus Syntrophocurvum alkaliphilum]QGU00062.1 ATP-dependent protease La [Candidatus Syntrophocurvum alkaliphilum]
MNELFMQYGGILYLIQLFFAVIIGLYFWTLLKNQQNRKSVVVRESDKESLKLKQMRNINLTEPLSSLTRPTNFNDVIGQKEGVDVLRSALCGPNPQHIIIYGSPGVGKTAAARLVLEEAKQNSMSPFKENANFVEVDATITRFDERNIADPLIGSVHDPIYQGAGPMGTAGIPQPKIGACTKAHGGVLFIDEIGELHSVQMNKLLKVLEDRKVILESAYYSENDKNIPLYIHDIFKNGLPADFRLIGATTRTPEEIPPALRSRCLEVFFKPLDKDDIKSITLNAINKVNFEIKDDALEEMIKYASNGREAVNIVQLASGIAMIEKKTIIDLNIIEKVLNNGRFTPRVDIRPQNEPLVGVVSGLAVYGANTGTLIEVEASAQRAVNEKGTWTVTGIIEEEEVGGRERTIRRKSMAKGSIENVLTTLKNNFNLNYKNYDIHINFPGGTPIDGSSAGITIATAIYSACKNLKVNNLIAMTGEISVQGKVKPVGGVVSKIEAARKAGIAKVLIPKDNYLSIFDEFEDIKIVPVTDINEVFNHIVVENNTNVQKVSL